jgi:hypothetical protein
MTKAGNSRVGARVHRGQLARHVANLNASSVAHGSPAHPAAPSHLPKMPLHLPRFADRTKCPSMPTDRGRLARKRSAGLRPRPARRTVPSCTRRAGLLASKNAAFGRFARAAQKHAPHFVDGFLRVELPHRHSLTRHSEMDLRAPDRLSRETSKTGLRPVGRAAVAAFETGLRPVRTAPTGHLVSNPLPRPARRPVSGCRRRAGLLAHQNVATGCLARAAQAHPPHIVDAPPRLGQPHRSSPSLHLEMALRSAERSSRETSKTCLRPVGRAAVAAFETGLRPVRRAPTGRVVADLHARALPAPPSPPRPSPRFSRWTRASSSATIALPNTGGADVAQQLNTSSSRSDARVCFHHLRRPSRLGRTPQHVAAADRAGRCAPVPAAEPQGVGRASGQCLPQTRVAPDRGSSASTSPRFPFRSSPPRPLTGSLRRFPHCYLLLRVARRGGAAKDLVHGRDPVVPPPLRSGRTPQFSLDTDL